MKCQNCNVRQATVHFKETINGVTREMNLCGECAAKMQGASGFMPFFSEFFAPQEYVGRVCPTCGADEGYFNRNNRFSCPDCYNAFAPSTDRLLKQIHNTSRHKADLPRANSELAKLKEKLEIAITNEQYEEAAKIRDEIKELENKEADKK